MYIVTDHIALFYSFVFGGLSRLAWGLPVFAYRTVHWCETLVADVPARRGATCPTWWF
jgi:hypothetical protein